jgi:hypothetical protein
LSSTGSVPQFGPAAAALPDGAVLDWPPEDPAGVAAAVVGDGVDTAPGAAHAATRIAVSAAVAKRAAGRIVPARRCHPMLTMKPPPLPDVFSGSPVV